MNGATVAYAALCFISAGWLLAGRRSQRDGGHRS